MRTTNEPSDPFTLPAKPAPAPPKPQAEVWSKTDKKGIEQNQDGKLRTNIKPPPLIYLPNELPAMSHDYGLVDYD